ncbi:MAG: hypothetical protein KQI35_00490 [Bacteroidetes bacterium]|nr:hypothetical protein [Bacteroidota bacterium]
MNYYLKCEHCGHLNEVKTEYLVFCQQCNKKLGNNYTNWKMTNFGKSFEDFKKEACITSDHLQQQEPKSKSKKKRMTRKQWIAIIIGITMMVIIGKGTELLIRHYFYPSLEKYTQIEWTQQTCGTLGLRLEAPLELKPGSEMEKQIPEEAMNLIQSVESYQTDVKNRKLYIMANSIRYNPEINASLDGAIQGSIQEFQNKMDVENFQYDVTPIRQGELVGGLITGKWKEGSDLVGYRMVIFVKGTAMWQVLVGYDYTDPFGREIADKIIQSIRITPNIAALQLPSIFAQ